MPAAAAAFSPRCRRVKTDHRSTWGSRVTKASKQTNKQASSTLRGTVNSVEQERSAFNRRETYDRQLYSIRVTGELQKLLNKRTTMIRCL